jgi:hypothetical protein
MPVYITCVVMILAFFTPWFDLGQSSLAGYEIGAYAAADGARATTSQAAVHTGLVGHYLYHLVPLTAAMALMFGVIGVSTRAVALVTAAMSIGLTSWLYYALGRPEWHYFGWGLYLTAFCGVMLLFLAAVDMEGQKGPGELY